MNIKVFGALLATVLLGSARAEDLKLLLDVSAQPKVSIHKAETNNQSSAHTEVEGKPAILLTWEKATNRVLETVFVNGPAIEGIGAGKELLIEVNRTDFPGLMNMGFRVKSASGRVFHYSVKMENGGGGWESLPLELGPDLATQQFGPGGDAAKESTPEEPAVLLSLVFRAPPGFTEGSAVAIGNISVVE